jgi:hypothetical protein
MYPKIWGYFCNFQTLPKVNNRPIGENSPNLVTLNIKVAFCDRNAFLLFSIYPDLGGLFIQISFCSPLLSIFFPPESNSIKICKRKKILLVLSIKV